MRTPHGKRTKACPAVVSSSPSLLLSLVLVAWSADTAKGQAQPTQGGPAGVGSTADPARADPWATVPPKKPGPIQFRANSFTFVRLTYSGPERPTPSRGRGAMASFTDYPDSDLNFSARFEKETGLSTDPKGKVLDITDSELKKYPFAYLVEGGNLVLSKGEAAALRGYLLGGGFLMVDDFWGEWEWDAFATSMKAVFPEYEPREIPFEHPIFHVFYDLPAKPQVPNVAVGTDSQYTGITWERADAKEPHYRGLFDRSGRLMAIFCHNTDLGDGWERESESAYYFREFSEKRAYPMGINIVVYALTR